MNRQQRETVFRQWVEQHYGLFVHVARGFASPSDQDDLLQEILLAAWHAIPAFRGDSSPATFLYRVAQNTALTWSRPRRRQLRTDPFDESAHQAPPADNRAERTTAMYAAIRELPETDRALLLLYLDELSYRQISEITGLSESNVGARLNRIRNRLATHFEEKEQ